jgi:thioredoxin 1
MDWFLYVIFGLTGTWVVYLLYLQLATRSAEGRPASDLAQVLPELAGSQQPALVYCYSPRCGPCRGMNTEVEALQRERPRIFKLDISQHLELAQEIGIRATPTVLVVKGGQIERCVIGVKPRAYLQSLLDA